MTYYFDSVFISEKYSLLSSDKYKPIVLNNVDEFINDYYIGEKTIELAESKYQNIVVSKLLEKNSNIDVIINGDLQNQILSSTICASKFNISNLGIYSACASFVEGIVIGSFLCEKDSTVIVSTSSHNLVSEKQFRYPIEYGAVRKNVNTCTASGAIGIIMNNLRGNIKVESATIGKVKVTNHKDSNDMGSAMASSCAETLINHLKDTNRLPSYYDLILTGDLGIYGIELVKKYYKKVCGKSLNNIMDAGSFFYTEKNIYAGSSGPCVLPLVLFDYILKSKKYKKILIIGTGSLHSVLSVNLKLPIPSISHAVSLEVK